MWSALRCSSIPITLRAPRNLCAEMVFYSVVQVYHSRTPCQEVLDNLLGTAKIAPKVKEVIQWQSKRRLNESVASLSNC